MSNDGTMELTCKPLDTYEEIEEFIQNPPPWLALYRELTPHSKCMIKNSEINHHWETFLESPETFCHFDPDAENLIQHKAADLPKTLVCHDMKNGYHSDSYVDGATDYDAYTFYNWAGIDIFCYFSHHLITIPPLGWINVGHDHGVKVIGTVITEWSDGIEFWDRILASEREYTQFANYLISIAKTLKFEGWLLNIENKIAKPDVLLEFVRYLHHHLHLEVPHAELIWYDSVTVRGTLNWQNGLNDKNWAFFEACDGLFTNYSWVERNLADSAERARTGSTRDRRTDLYIGIDVWGRNFYGGGQFNTQEAVKLAHSYKCSLAIFAPAWTHEALSTDQLDPNAIAMAEGLDKWQQFLLRDRALWGSLWPFLNTRLPCALPFKTSFCRGLGKKRRMYGEVLCNSAWYNLRHQQYQPNSAHGPHGYMLSTLEEIIQHSKLAIKGQGILRYPRSFQTSRQDLHSTKMREPFYLPRADSLVTVNELRDERDKSDKPPRKTTFLEKIKRIKSTVAGSDSDLGEGPSAPAPPEAQQASTADITHSVSMMAPSVNLQLGRKGSRRRLALARVPEERECLELYLEDSFHGGACLRVNPCDEFSPEHRHTRLFHCDILCETSLVVCTVTKTLPGQRDQYLNMMLFLKGPDGEDLRVVLTGRSLPHPAPSTSRAPVRTVPPLEAGDSAGTFRRLQAYLLHNQNGFYVPTENLFGWVIRYYWVEEVAGFRVTSINCSTGLEEGAVLLGHLGLCHGPA